MAYVKAHGGQTTYPYSIGQLRKDNPNISFPRVISDDLLASFGVYPVSKASAPSADLRTKNVEENSMPSLVGDVWVLGWSITDKTTDEIAEYASIMSDKNRELRNNLLAQSDWVVTKAIEQNAQDGLGIQIPASWLSYRQALRDITSNPNWPHLSDEDWPTSPA